MADSTDQPRVKALSDFIWSVADLLRGPYRPPQYERVMLPLVVLRRLDAVLDGTREALKDAYEDLTAKHPDWPEEAVDARLRALADQPFHNRSGLSFESIKGDPDRTREHLEDYVRGFDAHVRDIFKRFKFDEEIERMAEYDILHQVVSAFAALDLRGVTTVTMGAVFEDLIRRFNDAANETAGDHFTPRDVVALLVRLLFEPDASLATAERRVVEILDPTCGTGGMLAEAHDYLREHYPEVIPRLYGQDVNPRAYAIAASDALLKNDPDDPEAYRATIAHGDSLVDDAFADPAEPPEARKRFEYFLANPPFGVDWKRQKTQVKRESDKQGYAGRFGAGTPRVSDGALLFVQHMVSKFEPHDPGAQHFGSRMVVVLNGSPLFTGAPGGGESTIRRWLIEGAVDPKTGEPIAGGETDYLDTIVALPESLFFNTGIGTYVWVLTNRKPDEKAGTLRLVDARERFHPMARSLNQKRREITEADRVAILEDVMAEGDSGTAKTFDRREFGATYVTVERPLRLRVELSPDRQAAFREAAPHLVSDLRRIDAAIGRDAAGDYSEVEAQVGALLKKAGSKWRAADWRAFRAAFTEADPAAEPVEEARKPMKAGETLSDDERRAGWHRVEAGGKAFRVRYEPDADLRDVEAVPLLDDVDAYFEREVRPHVPEAWMDRSKDKVGYEINFNRYFYTPPEVEPLEAIDADLKALEAEIAALLAQVTS